MPTKDKQIAQEAVRKLALKLYDAADRYGSAAIEAELHRALDPLLEAAKEVIAAKTYVFRVLALDNLNAILEKRWRK